MVLARGTQEEVEVSSGLLGQLDLHLPGDGFEEVLLPLRDVDQLGSKQILVDGVAIPIVVGVLDTGLEEVAKPLAYGVALHLVEVVG